MSHRTNDETSLALARRIAEEIGRRPDCIDLARANLARWSDLNRDAPGLLRCYREWQAILERSVPAVIETMLAETDEGQRLRQNSPFAGVLDPREVWEIKRRVRRDTIAT